MHGVSGGAGRAMRASAAMMKEEEGGHDEGANATMTAGGSSETRDDGSGAREMRAEQAVELLGRRPPDHRLKERFLRWQCRVRQLAMREHGGRPDDAVMPSLTLADESEPLGHVITLIGKWGAHSRTAELRHLVKRTNDPAERRTKALELFSETWYQQAREFSDTLTATFPPGSAGAARIVEAGRCTLDFNAYNERFTLDCAVRALAPNHPLYQATWWHNILFNPALHPDTVMLAFEPDWELSTAGAG